MQYEAHFERSSTLEVTGWLRRRDNRPTREALSLELQDDLEPIRFELYHRSDLEAAGIADGCAGFRIDVGSRVAPGLEALRCRICAGEGEARRVVASATCELPDFPSLVTDPLLLPETHVSLRDWTIDCAPNGGLRIDRFTAPRSMIAPVRTYTRIACTEALAPDGGLVLGAPLRVDALGAAPVLKLAMLMRADRPTRLVCSVRGEDGRFLARELFVLGGEWREMHRVLCDAEALRSDGGEGGRLELHFEHAGRGHVDVAVCSPSGAPTLQWMHSWLSAAEGAFQEPAPEPVRSLQREHISNGDFERWSRGVRFEPPLPDGPLCDGWYLECRKATRAAASVSLERVSDSAVRAVNTADDAPAFGVRVIAGAHEGPMRLTTLVSPAALQESELEIEFGVEATGERKVEHLRRVMLVAHAEGGERIVHVLQRWPRVRRHARFVTRLDEAAIAALRERCAGCSGLSLVFELEGGSDVVLHGVGVRTARPAEACAPTTPVSAPAPAFEDPVIRAQLDSLRGLSAWRSDDHFEPVEGGVAPRAHGASKSRPLGMVAPTWQRPYDGYPSVDIVVPIYNALDSVIECVRSVLGCTRVPYTLMLLDDASDEATASWLGEIAARYPHVQHLRNDENLGYTRNVNRGLAASTGDRVCVLNSDCIVTDGWLERLIDCSLSAPAVGMVGPLSNAASYQSVPRVRNGRGAWDFNEMPAEFDPQRVAALVDQHSERARPDVGVINGFCQLISRPVIERIGLLDERAFPRGFGEENDYCVRAVKAGFRLLIADDVYVYHAKSQSFGHQTRKDLSALGRTSLHAKHPDVDWTSITSAIESDPALRTLRARLLEHGL